jgi:hypothetical protein
MRNLIFGLLFVMIAAVSACTPRGERVDDEATDAVTTEDVVSDTTHSAGGGSLDGEIELDTPVEAIDITGDQL